MLTPAQLQEKALIEAILKSRKATVPRWMAQSHSRRRATKPVSPLVWAEKYRRIDGKRFTLEGREPLRAIYEDEHRHIAIIKPSQVGLSEFAVTRALHALDCGAAYWKTGKDGLNVGYLLPTGGALSDFSKERFSGVIRESRHLTTMFSGGFDDVKFKQVGASYLYLRATYIANGGANNASQLLSFPADMLILDEYDRMVLPAVELARRRLNASVLNAEINISTPTIPHAGIHAAYLESDQQQWYTQCPACKLWGVLDFFRDVYLMHPRYGETWHPWREWQYWTPDTIEHAQATLWCVGCHQPLPRHLVGQWIPKHPERTTMRGYEVNALSFPHINLVRLAKRAVDVDPTRLTEFYRSDLGMPYVPKNGGLTIADVQRLRERPPIGGRYRNITMGVDIGARFHVAISGELTVDKQPVREIIAMLAVGGWDDIAALISKYRPQVVIVDANPEVNTAPKFAANYPRVVYRAYYNDKSSGDAVKAKPDDQEVEIFRTGMMDQVFADVVSGNLVMPVEALDDPEVVAHLCAPQRAVVTNRHGEPIPAWVHTKPDHYFHALVYERAARELLKAAIPRGVIAMGRAKGW
jgi:hypothetical protein